MKRLLVVSLLLLAGTLVAAPKETPKESKSDTAKPKESSFEVTGDFDAAELVKALNAAGFHAKIEK